MHANPASLELVVIRPIQFRTAVIFPQIWSELNNYYGDDF